MTQSHISKHFLFALILVLPAISFAETDIVEGDACIQVIQPAVSPEGVCQEFTTPCDVPDDWKSIPSCEIIERQTERTSLEQKMQSRSERMRRYWQLKAQTASTPSDRRMNSKSFRVGRGSLTRGNARYRRLPTQTTTDTDEITATTDKNYHKLDQYKRYLRKGGYVQEGDTTKQERTERRQSRAPVYSRANRTNRSGNLKNTIQWSVLSRQHTTQKNYGRNPYNLQSKYNQSQREKRAENRQTIDIRERLRSRARIYRGKRMEGNLSGDDLLDN